MMGLFKRYGFAAVVATGLALMTLVVAGKAVFTSGDGSDAKAAPAAAEHRGSGGGGATSVTAIAATAHDFNDAIQAIGTAQARESIVITPKVADTIRAIRFDSGAHVRQGQVLVEMSSVEQGADLAEARANNAQAQENLRRYQELFNRGFASQAQLDTYRAAADAAQARVDAGGSRISDRTIRAPFSGIIGLRTASPGQYVQPGTQIGTLDDTSTIKLDFDVPETDVARVATGVAIVAHTAAYPSREFIGNISNVDSRIDPATRTVRVRAMLPNSDGILRPGMLMTVQIRSNPRSALAIPEIAIVDAADGSYVFRVATGNLGATAERVPVRTGQRADGVAEILSGLNAGDMIITEGIQSVRPGQPVRVSAPAQRSDADALELRPRG
jgi:membrane fusion protein (multidrug efflux system)